LTTITRLRSLSSEMLLRASHAVRPAERTGGVGGLDDVVRALGALRVARQAPAGAQTAEVLTAGEELVDVGLVAGVEDHRVARRVEHAVDRERELDDPEVRAEMAARLRDVLDQEGADLVGELLELLGRERVEVAGSCDGRQQRHARSFRDPDGSVDSTRATHGGGVGWLHPTPPPCDQTSERSTYCRMPPLR
jgi:hypothetical protein